MSKIRFIGDIHSNFKRYLEIINNCERSIQVGDFGIGFNKNPTEMYDVANHKFIRGNHDWPDGCKLEPNYIPDGTFDKDEDIMYVGGAYSIDAPWRIPNLDWWYDEELSYDELNVLIDKFIVNKPKIMISHECPQFVTNHFNIKIFDIPSRTRNAFDQMFKYHKPELWIFGHWHFQFDKIIDGTRFICLNCDSYIDLDINGNLLEGTQFKI